MPAKNNLPYLTVAQTQELLDDLTFELRNLARGSSWPERIVNRLSVTNDEDDNILITYPEELANEIDTLEFGDLNAIPNAVLRPFVTRLDVYLNSSVGNVMADNMLMGGAE